MRRPISLMILIAVAIIVLDRITKLWVVEWMDLKTVLVIDVMPPFLRFVMAWNTGINFGLFGGGSDGARWTLIAIALVISVAVAIWAARSGQVLIGILSGLVIGGALGNVWDRLTYGAVADFLNMSCCGINNPYAFNVADISIFAGAIGLVLFTGGNKGA